MARSDDSEAKKQADARWNKKAYDRFIFTVRKDAKINGEFIRAQAASMGESVNGFLVKAVTYFVENNEQR